MARSRIKAILNRGDLGSVRWPRSITHRVPGISYGPGRARKRGGRAPGLRALPARIIFAAQRHYVSFLP